MQLFMDSRVRQQFQLCLLSIVIWSDLSRLIIQTEFASRTQLIHVWRVHTLMQSPHVQLNSAGEQAQALLLVAVTAILRVASSLMRLDHIVASRTNPESCFPALVSHVATTTLLASISVDRTCQLLLLQRHISTIRSALTMRIIP